MQNLVKDITDETKGYIDKFKLVSNNPTQRNLVVMAVPIAMTVLVIYVFKIEVFKPKRQKRRTKIVYKKRRR